MSLAAASPHSSVEKKGAVSLFSSVQFSRSVVSDSLGPHESQHARPPCPSLTPGVHSNSSPLSPHTSLLMGVHGGALVL